MKFIVKAIRQRLWNLLAKMYPIYLNKIYGMKIAKSAIISYRAKLDKSINPEGIHVGDYSWILANAVVLAHDHSRGLNKDTHVGKYCIIGINSIIMPGIKIGDHVVVGAGSVVTKDVPAHCIVAGNPAKVIENGISINEKGQIV